jgi:peptidoglycan/LPS O-acetylase OafA/YrhL
LTIQHVRAASLYAKPVATEPSDGHRYGFAQALRGPAALCVVASHFLGVFFTQQTAAMRRTGLKPITGWPPSDSIVDWFVSLHIFWGQLGVGIFFVLSGFVIALAVLRESSQRFIIRRLFRIYPTYIVGLLVVSGLLAIIARLQGVATTDTAAKLAAQATIIARPLFNVARVDGISWTLEVELVFYAVMAMIGQRAMQRPMVYLPAAITAVLAASIALAAAGAQPFLVHQVSAGSMIAAGVAMACLVSGRVTVKEAAAVLLLAALSLAVLWGILAVKHQWSIHWLSGPLAGLTVFVTLCVWRSLNNYSHWLLKHLADISYPLYIVHAFVGYAIMNTVVVHGGGIWHSVGLAVAASYGLSVFLHVWVEKPAITYSRKIADRFI